jgi:hypothetical protein
LTRVPENSSAADDVDRTNLQHFGTMLVPRIEAILDSYGW